VVTAFGKYSFDRFGLISLVGYVFSMNVVREVFPVLLSVYL